MPRRYGCWRSRLVKDLITSCEEGGGPIALRLQADERTDAPRDRSQHSISQSWPQGPGARQCRARTQTDIPRLLLDECGRRSYRSRPACSSPCSRRARPSCTSPAGSLLGPPGEALRLAANRALGPRPRRRLREAHSAPCTRRLTPAAPPQRTPPGRRQMSRKPARIRPIAPSPSLEPAEPAPPRRPTLSVTPTGLGTHRQPGATARSGLGRPGGNAIQYRARSAEPSTTATSATITSSTVATVIRAGVTHRKPRAASQLPTPRAPTDAAPAASIA